jgi:hypothetical protein
MKLFNRDIPPRAAAAVVALALLASVVAGREKPADPAPIVQASIDRNPSVQLPDAEIEVEKLKREETAPSSSADPFAPKSFAPPPPKRADAAPARPTAPPLPFTYLGKVIDGGKTVVFVARADENYTLEAGQTVAGNYHVDKITDTTVTFTYLPMKTRQTLQIPASE